MTVSPDPVHRAAALARIPLAPGDAERLRAELSALPPLAGGASTTSPAAHAPTAVERAPFRDPALLSDSMLLPPEAVAPQWRDGFFLVPHRAGAIAPPALDAPGLVLPGSADGAALDGPALAWRPVAAQPDAAADRAAQGGGGQ